MDYKEIMNNGMMWVMCIPAVAMAALQAFLITKKAIDAGQAIKVEGKEMLSQKEAMKAFKTGAVAAVGPAVSSVVVMLGLMASIGGAFAWLRLCFIGSATTELTAASLGAAAMGVELGGEGYDVTAYANSVWACTLNAFGWLFVAGALTPQLATIKRKITGDDPKMLALVSTSAMVGAFSYLSMNQIIAKKDGVLTFRSANIVIFVFSLILMFALLKISDKYPKLKEHNLSIVLLAGMGLACVLIAAGVGPFAPQV